MSEEGMLKAVSDRMQRMEAKLDNISEALIHLARIDERQIAQNSNIVKVLEELEDHEGRITTLEKVEIKQEPFFGVLKFVGTGAAGAILIKVLEKIV